MSDCVELVLRDNEVAKKSRLRDFGWYCLKALVLMILLTILGTFGPSFPAILFVFAFLIYAVPATMGSMYNVVKNRLHRQDLYNEYGNLSRYNRRWFTWFGGFFVVYLISSASYTLQASAWGVTEWLLMYAAIIGYYFIFLFVQYLCKKEYSVKYFKARAIKWSIIVTAILLAVVHTLIVSQPATEPYIDLHEIVDGRYMPFENSPCVLLSEADKLTTYANQLTEYGINKITTGSYAVAVIVNLVLGFSAFIGVVSQFGACLLTKMELRSEFQLLPANDGDPEGVVLKRYVVILVGLWLILSAVFIVADQSVAELRETEQYMAADHWVDQTTDLVILVAEEDIELVKEEHDALEEARDYESEFLERRDSFIDVKLPETASSVSDYYEECSANVDSFMEWYDSILGRAARIMPIFGEDIVKDEFVKRVIDPVSSTTVEEKYETFLSGLKGLYDEHANADERKVLPQHAVEVSAEEVVLAKRIPASLDLWVAWDSDSGKTIIKETLLGQGDAGESSDDKERIVAFINARKDVVLSMVKDLPEKFFQD